MLLNQLTLPYNTHGVQLASIAFFVSNITLLVIIFAISICWFIPYLQTLQALAEGRVQILSLPLMPMTFSMLINMITLKLVHLWGPGTIDLVWILW